MHRSFPAVPFAALTTLWETPVMPVLSGGIKDKAMEIDYRNVNENDFNWLYDLRFQTMSKYVLDSGDQFIREIQSKRIIKDYKSIKIVRIKNEDIGMFKVNRDTHRWTIVQIQLLPVHQGLGIGSRLIHNLQTEASNQGIPVFLSVLKVNPARRLYERLGFEIIEEKEKSYTMRYSA